MLKKVNVLIQGLNASEKKEYEVLDRDTLMEKIDNVDWQEVYKATYKKAEGYTFGGRALTYIDARDGELKTYWIGQNSYNHPFDDFYEIVLCSIPTQMESPADIEFLNQDEYEEFQEGLSNEKWDSLKKYADEKNIDLDDRKDNIIEYYASEIDMDWDKVTEQVDNLYENVIEQIIEGEDEKMKIEIYYNDSNDCVQMVQDGELKTHDEGINGCEFLSSFNIENVEDFEKLTGEEIIKGFNSMMEDFKYHSPSEVQEYLKNVRNEKIQGKLITCKILK